MSLLRVAREGLRRREEEALEGAWEVVELSGDSLVGLGGSSLVGLEGCSLVSSPGIGGARVSTKGSSLVGGLGGE